MSQLPTSFTFTVQPGKIAKWLGKHLLLIVILGVGLTTWNVVIDIFSWRFWVGFIAIIAYFELRLYFFPSASFSSST